MHRASLIISILIALVLLTTPIQLLVQKANATWFYFFLNKAGIPTGKGIILDLYTIIDKKIIPLYEELQDMPEDSLATVHVPNLSISGIPVRGCVSINFEEFTACDVQQVTTNDSLTFHVTKNKVSTIGLKQVTERQPAYIFTNNSIGAQNNSVGTEYQNGYNQGFSDSHLKLFGNIFANHSLAYTQGYKSGWFESCAIDTNYDNATCSNKLNAHEALLR
jgi:hypothetical protein